ncbi:molybdate ABC transporter permease subunit [Helicobacter cetorum]|uniref:Molybdenum transport system permease n=1 Tax=Helicobacter cetorum (strain ATCC BAA-540 / CCUG 52418 / MIT 99-5656) TaxID=1163745 RepID=I0ET70_HELCM|nr:molybdate ABC transporter permease subunit [Helicobacter cetorum]AFI06139.1 molybdenum ABC transporter ModB [Helicobacter cetorum MIT 99-5656]
MDNEFLITMRLSFSLALITTLILLPIGIFLGYFLSFKRNLLSSLVETLVYMPLVLPPSVLGFYLLLAFSPNSFLGAFLQNTLNLKLAFSFQGLVIGSVIFSLPFMVSPIKSALISLPTSLKEASYSLGKKECYTLFFVLLPNIKPSLLIAIITTFIHTIGEFGVVMMLGGDILGETRVASIAIFNEAEALNYAKAHQYALTLTLISFSLLFITLFLNKKQSSFL